MPNCTHPSRNNDVQDHPDEQNYSIVRCGGCGAVRLRTGVSFPECEATIAMASEWHEPNATDVGTRAAYAYLIGAFERMVQQ